MKISARIITHCKKYVPPVVPKTSTGGTLKKNNAIKLHDAKKILTRMKMYSAIKLHITNGENYAITACRTHSTL